MLQVASSGDALRRPHWRQLVGHEVRVANESFRVIDPLRLSTEFASFRVSDANGRQRSLFLRIRRTKTESEFREQRALLFSLEDNYRIFAELVAAEQTRVHALDGLEVYAYVERWVRGQTIAGTIERGDPPVRATTVATLLPTVATALEALASIDAIHTGFATDSIVIEPPHAIEHRWDGDPRIINLALVEPRRADAPRHRAHNAAFIGILAELHNAARRGPLRNAERLFLDGLFSLADRVGEEIDVPISSGSMQTDLSRLLQESSREAPADETLDTPFAANSAELLADDRLFVRTFATSVPWLQHALEPENTLILGPRGCGKSTLLRWMSLRPHLSSDMGHAPSRIAGFYVNCGSELAGRVPGITTLAKALEFRRSIVHLLNLLFAREVFQTLTAAESSLPAGSDLFPDATASINLWKFIVGRLGYAEMPIGAASRLRQAFDLVDHEILRAELAIDREEPATVSATGEMFLSDLARCLGDNIRYFSAHRVGYLLDDFSSERIPAEVQRVLNGLIWRRASTHVFKVSTDHYGFSYIDVDSRAQTPGREFKVIDCGKEYLRLARGRGKGLALRFTEEILQKRLDAAGIELTPTQWLGQSPWAAGHASLGRALRERAQQGSLSGRRPFYYGIDVVSELCSGDIATILLVADRIFSRSNAGGVSELPVPAYIQHDAIRDTAKELVEHTRDFHPMGERLYDFLVAFGRFIRDALVHAPLLGSGRVIPQVPRIEVDNEGLRLPGELGVEAQALYYELLRRSILIEMDSGHSRHGNVPTLRLHLRRIFLPHFMAALGKTDALKLSAGSFSALLDNPESFLRLYASRWVDPGSGGQGRLVLDDDESE